MRRFSRLHLEHGQGPLIFLFSDSTWMVDRMKILVLKTFFSFFFKNMIELLWLFQKMSCVLSSARENQIVTTIGTLLHHIHAEF